MKILDQLDIINELYELIFYSRQLLVDNYDFQSHQ